MQVKFLLVLSIIVLIKLTYGAPGLNLFDCDSCNKKCVDKCNDNCNDDCRPIRVIPRRHSHNHHNHHDHRDHHDSNDKLDEHHSGAKAHHKQECKESNVHKHEEDHVRDFKASSKHTSLDKAACKHCDDKHAAHSDSCDHCDHSDCHSNSKGCGC